MRERAVRAASIVLVVVLGAAALVEIAYATGAIDVGTAPGDLPAAVALADAAASLAMLAGIVLAAVVGFSPRLRGPGALALLAPAAALFLTAQHFGFDPYDLPTKVRYGGIDSSGIVAVDVMAVAAGIATWLRPRPGALATAAVLLIVLVTSTLRGFGH